ncbi:MAG: alpha/beta hydrolase [Thermoanaerobaculia bacterium]|nr:alpha/beta hydrolase [Thermoanaerobaculia bacterium]
MTSERNELHIEGVVRVDELPIHWQGWLPDGEARAVFLIVHGLAEHSGRYVELVTHCRAAGIACYGLDLRGHGRSDGLRVHVESFDEYHRDLGAVRDIVVRRHPDLPLFLVGHSMGGVVVLRQILIDSSGLAGAIVSSPALAAHPGVRPAWPIRLLAKLLARVAPRFQVSSGLPARFVSRDPKVVAEYQADPLVTSTASSGWYHAMLDAQREVQSRAADLTIPILVMQSGDDRLADPSATEEFVRSTSPRLVTYHRWTGLYHEMFHEPEKDDVFAFTEEWLERRLTSIGS